MVGVPWKDSYFLDFLFHEILYGPSFFYEVFRIDNDKYNQY